MLYIGFTKKYFTLWSVTTRTETTGTSDNWITYEVTNFNFIQNLSMTECEAIAKAKEFGCKNLTPDADLYGRSVSWSKKQVIDSFINIEFFLFGKYQGQPIDETDDVDYLCWYKSNVLNNCQSDENYKHRDYCNKVLAEKFGFVTMFGEKPQKHEYYKELYPHLKAAEKHLKLVCENEARNNSYDNILTEKMLSGSFEKNVNDYGYGNIKVESGNFEFEFKAKFKRTKANYYNGYEYYLPVDASGTARRIKNKDVKIVGAFKYDSNYGKSVFFIESFEII